ncbi:hypothetical protein P7H30_11530 [Streptococcus parauberis]|uniref:hypothetical protein n=1 Tax=Streptococcus parauberis TaxID=1348 RepID=UPI00288C86FD|nr:hypothetical protein [Streptococcus parauberis]MDT2750337.1 hypothetical protein [Streptococcus parauberis]
MSTEIKKNILKNFSVFSFSEIEEMFDYTQDELVETILSMEKDNLLEWNKEISKFEVRGKENLNNYINNKYDKKNEINKFLKNINNIINIKRVDEDFEKETIKRVNEKENTLGYLQERFSINNDEEFKQIQKTFESKQQELKTFSDSIPKTIKFKKLDGGNHWYGPSVKATTDDVNFITKDIQHFVSKQNKEIISVYKQFDTLYDLFSTLNREYIQRILANLKAINNVDENIREKLLDIERLEKIIQNHKKILKSHKLQLVDLQNKKDIDIFYNEFIILKEDLEGYKNNLASSLKITEKKINDLDDFKIKFNSFEHMEEIDSLYDDFQNFNEQQHQIIESLQSTKEKQNDLIDINKKSILVLENENSKIQNHFNRLEENQKKIETDNIQLHEKLSKRNKIYSIGLLINFIALFILIILLVNGAL